MTDLQGAPVETTAKDTRHYVTPVGLIGEGRS